MVILRLLSQLLSHHPDQELESLAAREVDLIMNRFYNPEYGIANEYLSHDYLNTVADNDIGVWDQAVDRLGNKIPRKEYHPKRKGNFHQPRHMMLNIESLERMLANRVQLTRFPE